MPMLVSGRPKAETFKPSLLLRDWGVEMKNEKNLVKILYSAF